MTRRFAPLVPAPTDADGRRAFAVRDGYLYAPRLLGETRLAPLRALVDGALTRRGWLRDATTDPSLRLGRWDDARWIEFLGEILPSEEYRTLAAAPELLAVLRTVLGGEPESHVGDVCRLVSPSAPELTTPPHQDAAYLKDAAAVWTAWLSLGPCPRECGPIAVWPGSHRLGLRPHAPVVTGGGVVGTEVPDDVSWAASDLEVGDVVFFSALTVHCALDNATTDRLRVSVDYRYRPKPPDH
jgi:ectoine hydroxylase-related dioxygenase (phytanoyl-CoA dioxygenase family)